MKDRVIFRKWNKGGDIIAIFPDIEANYGHFVMYEHIGQHGEGDYQGILPRTKLAKPEEYLDLYKELETIGYNLQVVKRMPPDFEAWDK